MIYKISRGSVPTYTQGQELLIYFYSSLRVVDQADLPWVGSDGNCATSITEHTNDRAELEQWVDWDLMTERYWSDTQEDGDRMRRRMAELLVYNSSPLSSVLGIVVQNQAVAETVRQQVGSTLQVAVKPGWYY